MPAIREYGLSLPVDQRVGSGPGEVRRPGDDLRHAGHLVHRAADRRAGELRHRALPHRTVARLAARPLGTAVELLAAVPSIVYGMWGLLVFGPILAKYVQTPLQGAFGDVPVLGALFSGPPVGIGILSAGIILAIMIIPFIASVMRDVFEVTPPMLKESAYGLGVHHLGGGVQGGAALHEDRGHRRHHARPGSRAGRDHGGHLRHRQLQPARLAVAVPGGQQHRVGAGQRVRRGRRRAAPGFADLSRAWSCSSSPLSCCRCPSCCCPDSRRAKAPGHERRPIFRRAQRPIDRPQLAKHRARKRVNAIALVLSLGAMAFGLFWLAWILFETIRLGIGGLALSIFTEMTPPPQAATGGVGECDLRLADDGGARHPARARRSASWRASTWRSTARRPGSASCHPLHQRHPAVGAVDRHRPVHLRGGGGAAEDASPALPACWPWR